MQEFTKKEIAFLKRLNTPAKIQDFLDTLPINFEEDKIDTIKSPLRVLRERNAHCMEGAVFAAYVLSLHGHKPLVMNFKVVKGDWDHVVAPFKINGYWGSISKTNHAVLRYREPVYKTLRELAMSCFHEYIDQNGKKTLRKYTRPLNINSCCRKGWEASEKDLWEIDDKLDVIKHYDVALKSNLILLRKADKMERKAGELIEWKIEKGKIKRTI